VNKVTKPIFTQTTCPLCFSAIVITWQSDDIPFFGEVMYTSTQCKCGFRYADTFILTQRDPTRFTYKVQSANDMNVRVIRSTSGTIRIPELEIIVEPGPSSDSYISNIEGVLCRIEAVLGMVSRWDDEPAETIQRAEDLLASLELIRNGKMEITLIIEDPLGNSAIVSEKVCKEALSSEEVDKLKTGIIVLEKDDLPDHF
jgi:zinc finger protein